MKSSFERFRLYHIDQSLRIRFQDLAGNDLGLRAGNYTVEHGFRLLRIHSRRRNFRCTVMHRYHDFLIDLIRQLRHDKQGDLVMFLIKQMYHLCRCELKNNGVKGLVPSNKTNRPILKQWHSP